MKEELWNHKTLRVAWAVETFKTLNLIEKDREQS
jgi:hypothetical protein